jgi:hypothetical protein
MKRFALTLFVLFAVLIGLYPVFYFLYEGFGLLQGKDEEVRKSGAWIVAFYMHIVFGGLALLIGWMQFFDRLRRFHKWVGISYFVFVLLGGFSGGYLAVFASTGTVAAIGFFGLALAWTGSTFLAYRYMRTRKYDLHEYAAIYSYALCFSAVTLRLWLPLLMMGFGKMSIAYPTVAWLCWLPNLGVATWLVTRRQRKLFNV